MPGKLFRIVPVALICIPLAGHAQAPRMPDDADPERGEALYAENCASCHGAELEGEAPDWRTAKEDGTLPAPPHDETGHTWHHGDIHLFAYTLLGGEESLRRMGIEGVPSAMPAFGDTLTEAEIWDILAFIKSTWPERIQDAQAERSQAERLATE
ncbi:c-type cytochrome [Psychromarinibacter sp. S121]|uniref:c-type cytochrome n=1 Tax=Psychromarinibacter sp. S121 TaxID=3415127 RepID=UPI003C79E4E0